MHRKLSRVGMDDATRSRQALQLLCLTNSRLLRPHGLGGLVVVHLALAARFHKRPHLSKLSRVGHCPDVSDLARAPRNLFLRRLRHDDIVNRVRLESFTLRPGYLPSLKHETPISVRRDSVVRRTTKELHSRSQQKDIPRNLLERLERRRSLPGKASSNDGFGSEKKLKMATSGPGSYGSTHPSSFGARYEVREPGARRRKLAEALKAANEVRKTYFGGDGSSESAGSHNESGEIDFPHAAVVRSGGDEMVLFPSYARKHAKNVVS